MDETNKNMEMIEGADSTKPHKTWFIERGDGYIFAAREAEAWGILRNVTEWRRRDFKVIGVSDGKTFFEIMREGRNALPRLRTELAELQNELLEYINTENHLKFKELADSDDIRLVKVKKIKSEINAKVNAKLKEISEITSGLHKKAFNAELEVARGHIEMPENQDVIAPGGDKQKILRQMGL